MPLGHSIWQGGALACPTAIADAFRGGFRASTTAPEEDD